MNRKRGLLVVVPCGQSKIWDKWPDTGAVPAKHAYRGAPFTVNRTYAEHFGERWVILSAKYGFIAPDFNIPGPYEVTFKRKRPAPVAVSALRLQVREESLDRFQEVIGLGGKDYRVMIEAAFEGTAATSVSRLRAFALENQCKP